MRYHAIAVDYDGTLALHGKVAPETLEALQRLRATGRRVVMVTGREIEDLATVFDGFHVFDLVVAENGALLHQPSTKEIVPLVEPPPPAFAERLKQRGVGPISVGHVIVATWEPHQNAVMETIHEMGLELQVIFNKGAVMVLPSGVNKGSGLRAALQRLELSPHNVVAVGDAENDHALLSLVECGVAVQNALPSLKDHADLVTRADHGAGVVEVVERLIATDFTDLRLRPRHEIPIGVRADGTEACVSAWGMSVLVAGPSGSGKSTASKGLLERIADRGYQFCVVDPEGDYTGATDAICVGDADHPPAFDEVLQVLARPDQNAVVNLIGIKVDDRPKAFELLFTRLQEMRSRLGRPHWLLLDETHHILPRDRETAILAHPQEKGGLILVTVHPDKVSPQILDAVNLTLAIGGEPQETLRQFATPLNLRAPAVDGGPLAAGEAMAWWRGPGTVERLRTVAPRSAHRRHIRKYATGELPDFHHFYFRGPEGRLKLRAQNLMIFLQMAEGVDDDTWMHHLRKGDYSQWFRIAIKDDELAREAEGVERSKGSPDATRTAIRKAVEKRYTAPA